jgi:anti-sigma B factor antagonist
MTLLERAVIVKEIPGRCDGANIRRFLQELAGDLAQSIRPAVVLDCSHACRIDRHALHLLLCSLEEAMKRNGDVRLAGLHPDAWSVLESTGIAGLFRSFQTTAEAVNSYRRPAFDRTAFAAGPATDQAASAA